VSPPREAKRCVARVREGGRDGESEGERGVAGGRGRSRDGVEHRQRDKSNEWTSVDGDEGRARGKVSTSG